MRQIAKLCCLTLAMAAPCSTAEEPKKTDNKLVGTWKLVSAKYNGKEVQFPEGETRLATFRNPYVTPTDGQTADTACWVRRIAEEKFQVFAVNCAHLGCPVRWFPQSGLFMCPCHGGAYYRDGARASGPPERGLFEFPYKVQDGMITIQAGELPTPAEVRAFLADKGVDRRAKKVEELLARPGHAALWTLKFGDLLKGTDFGRRNGRPSKRKTNRST